MTSPELDKAEPVDELAYRFWSIHPKELDAYQDTMPDGYKGGVRAWFFAVKMRELLAASRERLRGETIEECARVVDENVAECAGKSDHAKAIGADAEMYRWNTAWYCLSSLAVQVRALADANTQGGGNG